MASLQLLSDDEWLAAAAEALRAPATDLRLVTVRRTNAQADGDGELNGFMSDNLRVRVVVRPCRPRQPQPPEADAASPPAEEPEEGEEVEVAMFLKAVPEGNRAREALACDSGAFRKESGLYRTLAPRLHAVVGPDAKAWAPRLLFARKESLLVFEDLTAQGYKTLGGRQPLDFDHCAVALEAVARLHAASMALEEVDRRQRNLNPWSLGERFPQLLKEIMFTDSDTMLSYFIKGSVTSIQAIVEMMPEYKNSPQFEDILEKIEKMPEISWEIVKPSETSRNVICHGDLWVNNLMFKYDEAGKVSEARLVDFQLTRYCPPALDIQGLLHLSCRWPLRRERGEELRQRYYAAFCSALSGAQLSGQQLSGEELLPWKELCTTCDRYAAFGRIATAVYMPADLLPPDILVPQISSAELYESFLQGDRSRFVREAFPTDDFYRHRVREVTAELMEGLILPDKPKP